MYWTVERVIEEVKEKGFQTYKYVRMNDGEFRFIDICHPNAYHTYLVQDLPTTQDWARQIASAGMVSVYPKYLMMKDFGSTSLKIHGSAKDNELLSHAFNRPMHREF